MVVGYHLIWTAYGWWLPNDPRGSSSHEIRVERIAALGELHHGRQRVQLSSPELRRFYEDARAALKHELLTFSAEAISVIAEAFAAVVAERGYTCYACAILPDHVHALIRRHRDRAEEMIARLQQGSRAALIAGGRAPPSTPPGEGRGGKCSSTRGPTWNGSSLTSATTRSRRASPLRSDRSWSGTPGGCRARRAKRELPVVYVSRAARATLSTAMAARAAP